MAGVWFVKCAFGNVWTTQWPLSSRPIETFVAALPKKFDKISNRSNHFTDFMSTSLSRLPVRTVVCGQSPSPARDFANASRFNLDSARYPGCYCRSLPWPNTDTHPGTRLVHPGFPTSYTLVAIAVGRCVRSRCAVETAAVAVALSRAGLTVAKCARFHRM